MKVWAKSVFDIETGQLVSGEWDEYTGPVAGCKGAQVAQTQQQTELGMQQKAFDQQMAQLNQLQSQLSPYMTAQGQGYTPEQMAGMQSQFLNQNAQQFQNAGQAVRSALLARGEGGGAAPVGGDYTRGISSLMGAAASSQSQGLLGLQQQNAMQALTNRFNAASLMSGNAATLGQTQGVAGSGASSALQSFVQAKNSGLVQNLMSGLGSGLGQGLGAMATGGLSSLASTIGKNVCWVAAELYGGWNEPRTEIVRQWMYAHPIVLGVYRLIGKPLAALIRRNKLARSIVKPVFDRILNAAS